jgi:DNA-3-methyladenine glycosylase
MMRLSRSFYSQPTLKVAQQLLGKFLIRKIDRRKIIGKIVETEAYIGLKDKASHASKGKTKRTAVMFGRPGYAYVYMIYGMYYCMNIVTEREHYPAAVLIRAVEPIGKLASQRVGWFASGPGKVCQYFKIDKRLNGEDVCGRRLWVENRGLKFVGSQIMRAKRLGVDYAGKYQYKLWRFYIQGNPFVSKK